MKKPIFLIILAVVIIGGILGYFRFKAGQSPKYDFFVVKMGTVTQEVSTTGRVRPAESVDLAFEKSGRVLKINVKVGDIVKEGDKLITLENSDILAQLSQARANYESEKAKLEELKKGTRPEEIQIAQTSVANAEKSLTEAENELIRTQQKAEADLQSVYSSAITAVQKAVSAAKSSLLTLSDIQYSHFNDTKSESINIANAKEIAIESLFLVSDAGKWNSEDISTLMGGLYGEVQNLPNDRVEAVTSRVLDALAKVAVALNTVPISSVLTTTEKTNLSTEKSNINSEIVNVSSKQQAIFVQKSTNNSAIATAQAAVTTAGNTLQNAEDTLALKLAGSTPEQISAQEAKVKSARANVENIQAQLAKTILVAPIGGTIARQDAKEGEIVSSSSVLISIISESEFEIESNIPEADIAKVKIGDLTDITLDAYSGDIVFEGRVVSIDPVETIIEGVATYKTKIQFLQKDNRVKSGMTANTDILTAKKENILFLPQRAVSKKNGEQFVLVPGAGKGENDFEEKIVETGLRGSDGNVEILSGLEEGQKVIILREER